MDNKLVLIILSILLPPLAVALKKGVVRTYHQHCFVFFVLAPGGNSRTVDFYQVIHKVCNNVILTQARPGNSSRMLPLKRGPIYGNHPR